MSGFTVMIGGVAGIMEAANQEQGQRKNIYRGNIPLPKELQPNPWQDTYFNCRYFFVRKVLMFKYSYGFIIISAGIGTLDELLEAFSLIPTRKILNFPLGLMNKNFW